MYGVPNEQLTIMKDTLAVTVTKLFTTWLWEGRALPLWKYVIRQYWDEWDISEKGI